MRVLFQMLSSRLLFQKLRQLRHKRMNILKLPVNRSKPHIGHLVHLPQLLHDLLPHHVGGDLPLQAVLEILLDLVGHPLQLRHGDRPLLAGPEHTPQHLVPVEALPAPVLFNDHQGQRLHHLVGGKALFAPQAFPPAADALPFIGGAGIDNLALREAAVGAFHKNSPYLNKGSEHR